MITDTSVVTRIAEHMFHVCMHENKINAFSKELLKTVIKSAYAFTEKEILSHLVQDHTRGEYFTITEIDDHHINIFADSMGGPIIFNIQCDAKRGFTLEVLSNVNRNMVVIDDNRAFRVICQLIYDILIGKFSVDNIRTENQNCSLTNMISNITDFCTVSVDIHNIKTRYDDYIYYIDNILEFKNGFMVVIQNDMGQSINTENVRWHAYGSVAPCSIGNTFSASIYLRKDIVEKLAQDIIMNLASFSYHEEPVNIWRTVPNYMLIKNTAMINYNNQIYYHLDKNLVNDSLSDALLYKDFEQLVGQKFYDMPLVVVCGLINAIASWNHISTCTRLTDRINYICRESMSKLNFVAKDDIIQHYGSIENALIAPIFL